PTLLTLTVADAGDGIDYDHADWAAARLVCDDVGLSGLRFLNGAGPGSTPYGPQTLDRPANSVAIAPGADIQSIINAHASGTTYWIERGTHREQRITPK